MRWLIASPVVLLALPCLTASEDSDVAAALVQGDECASLVGSGNDYCAMSALQLQGVMGGRKEVAEVQHRGSAVEQTGRTSDEETQTYNRTAPSCYTYGCGAAYNPHYPCQCNVKCKSHNNCCPDFRNRCDTEYLVPQPFVRDGRAITTLYHQTSREACRSILEGGFKRGKHGGWCGNAIYFAGSPEATRTKAITPHSGVGCMLEVQVDLGRTMHYGCCQYCGGRRGQHIYWTEEGLKQKGFDSININIEDGPEWVIYDKNRVVGIREIPFNHAWTAHRWW